MYRLLKRHIIMGLVMVVTIASQGQQTVKYLEADEIFTLAKELFLKKQYIPAVEQFEKYLDHGKKIEHHQYDEAEFYVLMSQVAIGHKSAATALVKKCKLHPEHTMVSESYFQLANYYFEGGNFRRAVRYYELSDFENNHTKDEIDKSIFNIGYAYFKTKQYPNAKEQFAKLINKEGPYKVQSNYYYGYQCYVLRDFDCAKATFEKIKGKGPKTMNLYLAQIAYSRGKYEEALDQIKSIQIEKHQQVQDLLIGKCYYQMGQYDLAYDYFEKSGPWESELDPNEQFQISNAQFLKGEYRKAVDGFVKLNDVDNTLGQIANYKLGICFLKLDEKDKAFNAFYAAKSVKHDAEITEFAHFNYAKLASELQKNNVAVDAISSFISTYPNSYYADPAKGILADLFLSTKNYKAAIKVLEEINTFDEVTKNAYQQITFHRGEELFSNREYTEAYGLFQKSLKFNRDKGLEADAYFWLGEISYQTKDYKGAISNFNRFITKQSSATSSSYYGTALYGMGYAYYHQKQYATALNYFKKYEGIRSINSNERLDNNMRLGDCYFLTRQYKSAISSYQKAIEINYKRAEYAVFQQAILYGLTDQNQRKIANLKRIERDFGKNKIGFVDDAVFELGRVYFEMNQPVEAKQTFKRLISNHPKSPYIADAYLNLGLIEFNNGDEQRALSQYKAVVSNFAKSKQSKDALSYIKSIYINQGRGEDWINYLSSLPFASVSLTYQDSILYETAVTKYREGNCDLAISNFDTYLKRFGDKGFFSLGATFYKAECEYKKQLIGAAKRGYESVAAIPNNEFEETACIRLTTIYTLEKNCDKALQYFAQLEPIASSKKTYIESLMGQMRCLYEQGDKDEAKKKAIAILPIENVRPADLVEANMMLGKIQYEKENLLTAKFHFEYVTKKSPNVIGAEALYYLAEINFKQNELDTCRSQIFKINEDFSPYEYWVVKGFILLADIYKKEEDYFQARATLNSILDAYDGDEALLDVCRAKMKELEELENGKGSDDTNANDDVDDF